MEFLVYTAELQEENAPLDSYTAGEDEILTRIKKIFEEMNFERAIINNTINLFFTDVEIDTDRGIVTGRSYKIANPGKALHSYDTEGDELTIEQIISENDEALVKGKVGAKVIEEQIYVLVEEDFGSYFCRACNGLNTTPIYSGEAIESIQDSDVIDETRIEFAEDYDLTASLFERPEDGDLREEEGFGHVDPKNKLMEILKLSKSYDITLDIRREEWLSNVELFGDLIESGIVTTIKVIGTKDGIVKLGEGGDRAIRETIRTGESGRGAVHDAFTNMES